MGGGEREGVHKLCVHVHMHVHGVHVHVLIYCKEGMFHVI